MRKANRGAGGVDGIELGEIHDYLKENWPTIREKIKKRKYYPKSVRNETAVCRTARTVV